MIDEPAKLIAAVREKANSAEMPAAIVFNCHITGLAVARSLGKRGVPVVGLDREENGYGLWRESTVDAKGLLESNRIKW